MLDLITKNFNNVLDKIKGRKFLSEADLDIAAREIRLALLEADVSLSVVKDFIKNIKNEFVGQKVISGVKPGDMVVKIVNDELIKLFGEEVGDLEFNKKPIIILMIGLQGSGKTTTTAKIANRFKTKFNKKSLLVSLDIYRPAAQKQLETLANQVGIDNLEIIPEEKPIEICKRALKQNIDSQYDTIIFDTAGRLSIDEVMMNELKEIKAFLKPDEIIFVADSLTGQDAVNTAKEFNDKIGINSIVLTRLDGDGRGGAALSMRVITNCPIRYIGLGEKINDVDVFHTKRIVSRILDKGDIVSLVEKTEEIMNKNDIEDLGKKVSSGNFDFNDLLKQMKTMKKFGGLMNIISFLPGASKIKDLVNKSSLEDTTFKKQEAIINSMTTKERKNPDILNSSRKFRIANGSGTKIQDVNSLIKKFKDMKNMIQMVGKMDKNQMKSLLDSFGGNIDDLNFKS